MTQVRVGVAWEVLAGFGMPVLHRGDPRRHEIGSGEKPFDLGPVSRHEREPAASAGLRGPVGAGDIEIAEPVVVDARLVCDGGVDRGR
nr:hypothetical protein [Nocardia vaccinii]